MRQESNKKGFESDILGSNFGSNLQDTLLYSHQNDDALILTPFPNDAISNILNDAKPYRNVIKRYWTEEEDENLRRLVD